MIKYLYTLILIILILTVMGTATATTTHHKDVKYQPQHKPTQSTWHHPHPRIYVTPGISKSPPKEVKT